jgi:hypothetical protein
VYQRDPLSVRYDGTARQVLGRAIRASRHRKGIQAWVSSTSGELRSPDGGGRTAHERAFTRAAYYYVWREPLNYGRIPDWSLKVTWGPDAELRPSARGRMARPVRVRIFPRRGPRGGREHAYALPASEQWARNDALKSGGQGSPWQRFP